jgi:putative endonuclease
MPPRDYFEYRVAQHKAGLGEYTAKYNLDRLVYFESTYDVREAIGREKQIKSWSRAKKIALIRTVNPRFLDLAHGVPPNPPGAAAVARTEPSRSVSSRTQ